MQLTPKTYSQGIRFLSEHDSDLAGVIEKFGQPSIFSREPGFPALVLIILEQQVSLASARAVFARLNTVASPLSASRILELDNALLKTAGLTRQKLTYCKLLAEAIVTGQLKLAELNRMENAEARATLMKIKGIGPWTADIYLMTALKRQDIWPKGDLALAVAVQELKKLRDMPSADALADISAAWHPWRTVAAQILWHYYLSVRGKLKPNLLPILTLFSTTLSFLSQLNLDTFLMLFYKF